MTSPGCTIAPAHTTGMFTDPAVAFTVPCALIAFAHTGKFIAVMSVTSRTPASMTRPDAPRARDETASSSPNIPSVDSAVVVTTSTSPSRHSSSDAWIIRLSPAWHDTVIALPATLAAA